MSVWLGILPLASMEGHSEKQFREKSENATHNSSIIVFALDRWEENPIRLGSGESLPYLPNVPIDRHTLSTTD